MRHIKIMFDGGCRPTNPGNKYGSWEVTLDDFIRPANPTGSVYKVSQVEFGWGTNNEAEFNALQAALAWTAKELQVGGFEPNIYTLSVFTDSLVVKSRIQKRRTNVKVGDDVTARLGPLTRECLSWMDWFKSWEIFWRARDFNVNQFGH